MNDDIKEKIIVEYEGKIDEAKMVSNVVKPITNALDATADHFAKKVEETARRLAEHLTTIPGYGRGVSSTLEDQMASGVFGFKTDQNGKKVPLTLEESVLNWIRAGGQISKWQTSVYKPVAYDASSVEKLTKLGPTFVHNVPDNFNNETELLIRQMDSEFKAQKAAQSAAGQARNTSRWLDQISYGNAYEYNRGLANLSQRAIRSIANNKKLFLDPDTRSALMTASYSLNFAPSKNPESAMEAYELQKGLEAEGLTSRGEPTEYEKLSRSLENAPMTDEERSFLTDWTRTAFSSPKYAYLEYEQDIADKRAQYRNEDITKRVTGRMSDAERVALMNSAKSAFSDLDDDEPIEENTKILKEIFGVIGSQAFISAIAGIGHNYIATETAWRTDAYTPYQTKRLSDIQFNQALGSSSLWPMLGGLIGSILGPVGALVGTTVAGVGGQVYSLGQQAKSGTLQQAMAYQNRAKDQLKNSFLYGPQTEYTYATTVENTGYASRSDILGMSQASAMMPGAMAFGGLSEQDIFALSWMPNYWNGLINGASTSELVQLYKDDLMNVPTEYRPYISSLLPGVNENVRAYAMSDSYGRVQPNAGKYATMEKWSMRETMDLSYAKDAAALKDTDLWWKEVSRAVPTFKDEYSGRSRRDAEEREERKQAIQEEIELMWKGNDEKRGDINIYLNGSKVASVVDPDPETYITYGVD